MHEKSTYKSKIITGINKAHKVNRIFDISWATIKLLFTTSIGPTKSPYRVESESIPYVNTITHQRYVSAMYSRINNVF